VAEVELVIVDGPGAGLEFELSGALVVGRDENAGVVIEDPEASRKHASFSLTGDAVTVEDLGSTNGTFVNGERLSAPRTLSEGDRVRIGTTILEVRRHEVQATQVRSAIPDADAGPQPTRAAPIQPEPEPEPEPQPTAAAPVQQAPSPSEQPPPAFPPPGGPTSAGPPPGAPPPPGAGGPAVGQSPAPFAGAGPPAVGGYPAEFEADYPSQGIARWRVFFQGFLLIPHLFALFFVGIGAYFAFIYAWFAILFTRRYPAGAFRFIQGVLRWSHRVTGFSYLMTENYPAFSTDDDPSYPVRFRVRYPEGGIARWRVFLQGIMAIPHFIALAFVGIAAYFVFIWAWFSILFTRNYPQGAFDFLVGAQRWNARVGAYMFLMTEEYPPFALR
jgi:hypothetical protein